MNQSIRDEVAQQISLLKRSQILSGLSESQLLDLLNTNKILNFQQGELIFAQNSLNTDMYIIMKGKVNLLVDPETISNIEKGTVDSYLIANFEPGQVFGELAVFDGKPRSASAYAAEDETQLIVIPANFFTEFFIDKHQDGERSLIPCVLQNIAKDLSKKLRNSNKAIINQMLSVYFIKVLVEDLLVTHYECSAISPLKRQIVIHLPEYFILNTLDETPSKKEVIDTYFFAEGSTLKSMMDATSPNGEVIINTILSIIRTGEIPVRTDKKPFTLQLDNVNDTRKGELTIEKGKNSNNKTYSVRWLLKGIIHDPNNGFTYANLFLFISSDESDTVEDYVEQMIKHYDLPIQEHITMQLEGKMLNSDKFRVMVIHHRTHEVIATLDKLNQLGFTLDTVIGIPYGDASWESNIVLNQASKHKYFSLKTITDSEQPTKYVFDFKSSSFLSKESEKDLINLYSNSEVNGNYTQAMYSLIEYCYVQAIERCIANNQKLIIYEDGGYSERLYHIYHDKTHQLHPLIRRAVDDGLLVGIVEGTMSGERKHLQYLDKYKEALLPVLSSARSQVKTFFESKGIGESLIHSASTALGRIGLPTFQQRRIAILGGNGVIGRRLVEQLAMIHNGTSDFIVIDINPLSDIPNLDSAFVNAADRLQFHPIKRYALDENAQYLWLPRLQWETIAQLKKSSYFSTLETFLEFDHNIQKLVIANCHTKTKSLLEQYLLSIFKSQEMTWQIKNSDACSVEYTLSFAHQHYSIVLLPENTVLYASKLSPFILKHIDTIFGVTGYPVMTAYDLASYMTNPKTKLGHDDQLILASGSSKDYEFKQCIDFLDVLLSLSKNKNNSQAFITAKLHEYQAEFKLLFPDITDQQELYEALQTKLSIIKYIHNDVGSTYHVVLNDQSKVIHLLANGLVINFFAKHEKGAKSEYIDPIVTLQMLSVVRFAEGNSLQPGLYDAAKEVDGEYIRYMWNVIDKLCQPFLSGGA